MGYLPSSTPYVADLVHVAEDRFLGAVIAKSYHVLCPLSPYHYPTTWATAETS